MCMLASLLPDSPTVTLSSGQQRFGTCARCCTPSLLPGRGWGPFHSCTFLQRTTPVAAEVRANQPATQLACQPPGRLKGCRQERLPTWLAPTIHTTLPRHALRGGWRLDSRVRSASALHSPQSTQGQA